MFIKHSTVSMPEARAIEYVTLAYSILSDLHCLPHLEWKIAASIPHFPRASHFPLFYFLKWHSRPFKGLVNLLPEDKMYVVPQNNVENQEEERRGGGESSDVSNRGRI